MFFTIDAKFWENHFCDDNRANLFGYKSATRDMNRELKEVIETTTNYEELKKELTNLLSERTAFVDFASNNSSLDCDRGKDIKLNTMGL